jgi:hypothetical protein
LPFDCVRRSLSLRSGTSFRDHSRSRITRLVCCERRQWFAPGPPLFKQSKGDASFFCSKPFQFSCHGMRTIIPEPSESACGHVERFRRGLALGQHPSQQVRRLASIRAKQGRWHLTTYAHNYHQTQLSILSGSYAVMLPRGRKESDAKQAQLAFRVCKQ